MNRARAISVTILVMFTLVRSTVSLPAAASPPAAHVVTPQAEAHDRTGHAAGRRLLASAAAATGPSESQVETTAQQSRDEDLVAEVTEQFRLVGLELPPVMISFHSDREPCNGHAGIYRGGNEQHRVSVCVPDSDVFAVQLHRRRTLTHELAHVWEQANLGAGDRAALLLSLDAKSWYGPDLDWQDRGAERFAETIVWGLYDQLRRPTLIALSCRKLQHNFQLITGHDALGPVPKSCSAPLPPDDVETPNRPR
jgi:hypothetical protein